MVAGDTLAALAIFHDLNLASQFCDELILLKRGQVVAHGVPSQVLTPSVIERVYGARVEVMAHPHNGLPVVCPVYVQTPSTC